MSINFHGSKQLFLIQRNQKINFDIVQYGPKSAKRWVKKSFDKEVMIISEFLNLIPNATKDGKIVSKENMACWCCY